MYSTEGGEGKNSICGSKVGNHADERSKLDLTRRDLHRDFTRPMVLGNSNRTSLYMTCIVHGDDFRHYSQMSHCWCCLISGTNPDYILATHDMYVGMREGDMDVYVLEMASGTLRSRWASCN